MQGPEIRYVTHNAKTPLAFPFLYSLQRSIKGLYLYYCKDLWHCKCPYWDVAEDKPHCLYLCRVEKTLHITLNNHISGFVHLCIKYLNNPVKQISFTLWHICEPY